MKAAHRFRSHLEMVRRIHIDGRVLAFHLLDVPPYREHTREMFEALSSGAVSGQTSAITLYQVLAEVYRRGETDIADDLTKGLLAHSAFEVLPVGPDIAVQAARVRAQLGGRPERALQIATALATEADTFVTEGSGLRRIVGMSVLNLEDFADA